MNFIKPITYYKDLNALILEKNFDGNSKIIEISNIILDKGEFLINLIHFSLIFTLVFWTTSIIYFFTIRKKYITTFSVFAFKQNWWKIFYIPLLFVLVGAYWITLEPFIGEKNVNKSYFNKFIKWIQINKILPESKIEKNINEIEKFISKLDQKKKSSNENKISFFRLALKLKNDLKLNLSENKEDDYGIINEGVEKFGKNSNEVKDKEIIDHLGKPENKKLNDTIMDLLNSEKFWSNKNKALNSIKKIKKNGIVDFQNAVKDLK